MWGVVVVVVVVLGHRTVVAGTCLAARLALGAGYLFWAFGEEHLKLVFLYWFWLGLGCGQPPLPAA